MTVNKSLLNELIDAAYNSGYYSGKGQDGSDIHLAAISRRRRLLKDVLAAMEHQTDLLEALRWALPLAWDAITNGREALSYHDSNKQIDIDKYDKARAAIAKARGEQ